MSKTNNGHTDDGLDMLAARIFDQFSDTIHAVGFLQHNEQLTIIHILRDITQEALLRCKEEMRIEREADAIAKVHGFYARVLHGIKRVGVMGDERAYGAHIELFGGRRDDYKMLELVSTEITNKVRGVVGVSVAIAPIDES